MSTEKAPQAVLHQEVQDLRAENERLGRELAALRTLLAAVREAADVPEPADDADWRKRTEVLARRADFIAVYANPYRSLGDGPRTQGMLQDAAEALRKEAARPLRYTPKAAGPEPKPAGTPDPIEGEGSDLD